MKRIITILAFVICSVAAQAQLYRMDTTMYSLGDTVQFMEWGLFEYPNSRGCNYRLAVDSPARRYVTEKQTVIVPDSLIIYLGGPNERKIPRWIENNIIKQDD